MKVVQNKEEPKKDADQNKHVSFYPAKTNDEIQWINKILDKLDTLINQDYENYEKELKEFSGTIGVEMQNVD